VSEKLHHRGRTSFDKTPHRDRELCSIFRVIITQFARDL